LVSDRFSETEVELDEVEELEEADELVEAQDGAVMEPRYSVKAM
jgi:hypothetical protein